MFNFPNYSAGMEIVPSWLDIGRLGKLPFNDIIPSTMPKGRYPRLGKLMLPMILVLFACSSLAAQSKPTDVYSKYLGVVHGAKGLEELMPYLASDPQNQKFMKKLINDRERSKRIFKMIKDNSVYPGTASYDKVRYSGNRAFFTANGKCKNGQTRTLVRMIKEGSDWKVLNEKWENEVILGKRRRSDSSVQKKIFDKIDIPDDIKEFFTKKNLDKFFWIIFALPLVLAIFIIFRIRRIRSRSRAIYKEFALKNGFTFSEKDREGLAEQVKASWVFNKAYSSGGIKVFNVLSKSGWDGHVYIFDIRPRTNQKNSNKYSTTYYLKSSKDAGVDLYIRRRLPSLIEKMIVKLTTNEKYSQVEVNSFEEFNSYFVVYSDNGEKARETISRDLTDYLVRNKKMFKAPGTIVQLNSSGMLISFQHSNISGVFKSEKKLSEFAAFAGNIKDRIIEKIN